MIKEISEEDRKYRDKNYDIEKEQTLKELEETCLKTGDSLERMIIKFQSKQSYIENYNYNEPKFNAWSAFYVYVRGKYDGHSWVIAVPRNPSVALTDLTDPIGGG